MMHFDILQNYQIHRINQYVIEQLFVHRRSYAMVHLYVNQDCDLLNYNRCRSFLGMLQQVLSMYCRKNILPHIEEHNTCNQHMLQNMNHYQIYIENLVALSVRNKNHENYHLDNNQAICQKFHVGMSDGVICPVLTNVHPEWVQNLVGNLRSFYKNQYHH